MQATSIRAGSTSTDMSPSQCQSVSSYQSLLQMTEGASKNSKERLLLMFGNSKLDYERDLLWKKLLLGKSGQGKAGLIQQELSYLSEFVHKKNLKQ